MKVVKWVFVIVVTVTVTVILMSTFMQEAFSGAEASARIFGHALTDPVPVYVFVGATFAMGLLLGFFAAAYYYIAGQAGIRNKKKEIRRIEDLIDEKNAEIKRLDGIISVRDVEIRRLEFAINEKDAEIGRLRGASEAKGRKTASQKAVGERDLPI